MSRLLVRGRDSEAGRRASPRKLNGQFYTPSALADRMLATVAWPGPDADGTLLDPACGDGVFLAAAARKALGLGLSKARTRRLLTEGIRGWDLDAGALAAAKKRLEAVLAPAGLADALPRLERCDALETDAEVDCVVGNPPYLEAKRMPDALKARIRERCPVAARGAFDLYGAFVERAHRLVGARDGEVAFVLPNRMLVVAYAAGLRRLLVESGDVAVLDLSEERVFADAAVYPVVLCWRASEAPRYRVLDDADEGPLRPTVDLDGVGLLDRFDGLLPLPPTDDAGRRLFARLLDGGMPRLDAQAEVRWTVSFHRAGLRDAFVFSERPAGARFARPFIGGGRFSGNREVEDGRLEWGGWWIDYDRERAREAKNPLPPPELFEGPKVVLCQNARRARAALDTGDHVVKDTFLVVRAREDAPPALLPWLVLLFSSDLFHYLYEHLYAGTRKGGGYLHFLPRYLAPFPVPPPPDAETVESLHRRVTAGEDVWAAVEALVAGAYGLDADERAAVAAHPQPTRGPTRSRSPRAQ